MLCNRLSRSFEVTRHLRLARTVFKKWNVLNPVVSYKQHAKFSPVITQYSTDESTPQHTWHPRSIEQEDNLDDLSEEDRMQLAEIKVQLYELYESGERACDPEIVTPAQWRYILTLRTATARQREFAFIGRKHYLKHRDQRKQEQRATDGLDIRAKVRQKRKDEEHIVYGLGYTTLFLRINLPSMNRTHNAKLWRAKAFNDQKIIFDFSYDDYMNPKFANYTARHFIHFFAHNRKSTLPFDMHVCNANRSHMTLPALKTRMTNILDKDCPIAVHNDCYSDLYPRENILYLTPYSPHVLTEYNPDDVYVIGAIIDYGYHGPITMMRAKKLGIRTGWPPLDRYMNWGNRAKCLPLNLIGNILLDLKNSRNWDDALVHIPQRLRKQPRKERHLIYEYATAITDTREELPRNSWEMVRDQTRLLDGAKVRGNQDPIKNKMGADQIAVKPAVGMLDPFK